MAVVINRSLESAMRIELLRPCLVALVVCASTLLGGCDETEGGVGASVGLPSAFAAGMTTDPSDAGVGSSHWVGNPRW